jgi:hypothetical protein
MRESEPCYVPIANDDGYPFFVQDALPGCSVFWGQADTKGRENEEGPDNGSTHWSLHA